jgi:putative autoinducer-2 (AI-2) aldolase
MDWGRRHRLSRIFDPRDGRTNMLAVDHGYFLGPTHGMEQPAEAIPPLLPYADALMVTRGLLRATIDPAPVKAIVLRASGGPSVAGPALEDELITTSVEDAIRMDAAAVTTQVFVGSAWERQSVANLSALINEAGRFEIPVLAVTAVGKELGNQDLRYLKLAVRICAEIGADFVKTYYAEGFRELVESAMVPVVIAGGKKLATERDALQMAFDAIEAGAAGVDFGRNIWQSPHPVAMIRAVRAIVHEGSSVDRALELYHDLASDQGAAAAGAAPALAGVHG